MDYLLNSAIAVMEKDEKINLLVNIKAPKEKKKGNTKPLNICLVLDKSGSMNGLELRQTKISAKLIVERLKDNDIFSLVVFDDKVQTLILAEKITTNRSHIINVIDSIYAKGTTNLSGGLLKGIEILSSSKTKNSINRILLLTDGEANCGITNKNKLVDIAKAAKTDSFIITTTLGFGNDFNEDLLIEMAKEATGNFYYIENSYDAPRYFETELNDLQKLIAQNISVTIRPEKYVKEMTQITGHSQILKGKELIIELGDAVVEEEKRVLISFDLLNPGNKRKKIISKLCIKYTELQDDSITIKSLTHDVVINGEEFTEPKIEVLQELELQQSVKERKKALDDISVAIEKNDLNKIKIAKKRLQKIADKLSELPENIQNETIKIEIQKLKEDANALAQVSIGNNFDSHATCKIRKTVAENTNTITLTKTKLNKSPNFNHVNFNFDVDPNK